MTIVINLLVCIQLLQKGDSPPSTSPPDAMFALFMSPSLPFFSPLLFYAFSFSPTPTRKLKLYLGLSAASPCINCRDV